MAVKTVTLTVDAYKALAAARGEGESFSEVVQRLAGSRIRLSDFAGAWKGAPPERIREVRRFLKASDRISRKELARLGRRKRSRSSW